LPYLAMIRRKAASVTSAIGAKTKVGLSMCSQNPFCILLTNELVEYLVLKAQVNVAKVTDTLFTNAWLENK
jgi:hypothetical protein